VQRTVGPDELRFAPRAVPDRQTRRLRAYSRRNLFDESSVRFRAAIMDHILQKSARLQRLEKLAHGVRQLAINRPDDVEGWRIARLLRDAVTPAQADEAERQLGVWQSTGG
jgi:hypothetical protein